jgi:flagellar basal-body rod protein FlgB
MIRDLANSGAMPVLDRMIRFTAQRQQLIAHNIANLDTPDFRQMDASPASFQAALRKAVEDRRAGKQAGAESAGMNQLNVRDMKEVRFGRDGSMTLRPGSPSGNVLYHDRNNRDLEGLMQDLAENGVAFRMATDLMRRENDLLRTAISQRV